MRQFVGLEEAQNILKEQIHPIETEKLNIMQAYGSVLAEDIFSPINQPPFDRSPLDGYALRSEDLKGVKKDNPVRLKIIEEVYAGCYPKKETGKGMATRIMTGAPIPKGADCVIRQEDTIRDRKYVEVLKELSAWDNYCFEGEDVKKGELILIKERVLNFGEIGTLASLGIKEVSVYKKPKIAVLSTGDELMDVGEPLSLGKIYNSNLYTIGTRLKELWAEPVMIGSTIDDIDTICEKIKSSLEKADILITTGGVSVGEKDVLKDVMEKLGAEILFWRVNIKPGAPVLCSLLDGKLVISLSGNPAAATITFELLVRPILAKYTHRKDLDLQKIEAILQDNFLKASPSRRFVRGKIYEGEHDKLVKLASKHSSGILSSILECNCLIDIPSGTTCLKEGEKVDVFML